MGTVDLFTYPGLVYLFTQAWSTCLPKPGLPVYPGLVYLFTQAWSKGACDLRNHHFQNAGDGRLMSVGPGPSRQHFENDDLEENNIEGGDPS